MKAYIWLILLVIFITGFLIAEEELPEEKIQDVNRTVEIADENAARLDDLEDQMDVVERSTLVDRINFSADVRMTLNNFFYMDRSKEDVKPKGLLISDGNTFGLFNMRARIKMVSRLAESLKVTAWLTMYKQFLESAPGRYDTVQPIYDVGLSRYPSNSTVYMERLYLDWFILDWLSITLGRVPSLDGSPSDIMNDTVSLGTIPASNINAPLDAAYLSANLERFTGIKDFYARLLYIPRLYISESFSTSNLFVASPSENFHAVGFGINFEIPELPESMVYLNVNNIFGFKAAVKEDIDGDGIKEALTEPDSIGSGQVFYAGVFLYKFLESPFDIYGSIHYSLWRHPVRTDKNRNNGIIGIPPETNDMPAFPVVTLFGKPPTGQISTGYQINAGVRYTTPFSMFDDYVKIGSDFIYSSGNFYTYFTPDTTGLDKYSLIGMGSELYVIVPLHRKANIKLGYIFQHHTHLWGLVFRPSEDGVPAVDETIHNVYMMLNVYF